MPKSKNKDDDEYIPSDSYDNDDDDIVEAVVVDDGGEAAKNKTGKRSIPEAPKKPYSLLWDCPFVVRLGERGSASEGWKCLWCGDTFKKWNHTKVLFHLSKTENGGACTCRSITLKHTQAYDKELSE